jgi:hypothetical protein
MLEGLMLLGYNVESYKVKNFLGLRSFYLSFGEPALTVGRV